MGRKLKKKTAHKPGQKGCLEAQAIGCEPQKLCPYGGGGGGGGGGGVWCQVCSFWQVGYVGGAEFPRGWHRAF